MPLKKGRSRSKGRKASDNMFSVLGSPSPAKPGKSAASAKSSAGNSKSSSKPHYEFGGQFGAISTMVSLPLLTVYLILASRVGKLLPAFAEFGMAWTEMIGYDWMGRVWRSAIVLTLWLLLTLFLHLYLPSKTVQGSPIRHASNKTLPYTINGHLQFWVTLLIIGVLEFVKVETGAGKGSCASLDGDEDPSILNPLTSYVSDYLGVFTTPPSASSCTGTATTSVPLVLSETSMLSYLPTIYLPLAITTTAFCALLSTYLLLSSSTPGAILALGGDTPSTPYNYFIGRELNPRITILGREVDLKEWFELKPGLIGWCVINVAFSRCYYAQHGHVSLELAALTLSQGLYVWDALYNEVAILTTMDITTDGFGFMLCFGDLGWVPYVYTLQANYMLYNDTGVGAVWTVMCVVMGMGGYWIFRRANSEKDKFRREGPDSDPKFKYIDTKRGTKLMVSGWWGAARKINYTGDWILGMSWCMLSGTNCVVPYFYGIYFCILLIHRAWRDDEICRGKYGDDWDRYKKIVPHVFVPGVI